MIPTRQLETQKIVVQIDDVDIPNRLAHARDKTNVLIQCLWRSAPGGILRIPAQGEKWVVIRTGQGQWQLDSRLDDIDQHEFVQTLAAGDSRIDAGALHTQVDSNYMNGHGLGYTVKDNFYSASSWTTVTLSTDPATTASIHPVLNGLLITPDLYGVVGRVITFHSTMALGSLAVTYQAWQTSPLYPSRLLTPSETLLPRS